MTDISMTLPNASASTLQESFERLHLHPSPISSSYSESRLDARRPSLVAFQASSSGSFPTSSKRTALDAGHDGGRDRRDGADSIDAWGKRKMRTVGEGGCDRPHSGSSSDHDADRDMEMSRSSSVEGHRSGSGSRSGVESHGERSTSTLATSLVSSPDGVLKAQAQSGMSDGDGTGSVMTSPAMLPDDRSPQTIQPRTTYVNPSPTATLNSFPFVSSSFSTASSSSSYPISVEQAYLASFRAAKFNTHPNPPPFTLVTFGAGTHSKQLDAATAASEYGAFHVPSSAYPVGSGQFLAGGFGFIGRKHGLAMDNLVEAELVLADGRIVWVGEGGKSGGQWRDGEDPEEVWWGLRGAGAVLGVITRFRAKAFYLPSVYAGNLI